MKHVDVCIVFNVTAAGVSLLLAGLTLHRAQRLANDDNRSYFRNRSTTLFIPALAFAFSCDIKHRTFFVWNILVQPEHEYDHSP